MANRLCRQPAGAGCVATAAARVWLAAPVLCFRCRRRTAAAVLAERGARRSPAAAAAQPGTGRKAAAAAAAAVGGGDGGGSGPAADGGGGAAGPGHAAWQRCQVARRCRCAGACDGCSSTTSNHKGTPRALSLTQGKEARESIRRITMVLLRSGRRRQ